jgi:L-proline amide hydrolase
MINATDLTTKHGIPVIFYDQIGNGRSTHLPEKMGDESFWTEQLFLDELGGLIKHLNIQDDYDLFGHSWGGMLGSSHAARQPMGLKHLILSCAPASIELWLDAYLRYRDQMPPDIQKVLMQDRSVDSPEDPVYEKALEEFCRRHVCKSDPWPIELVEAFEWAKKDPTVSLTTLGASEFVVTGSMKNWSVIDVIHKITATTLVVNGLFEGADDAAVTPFFERLSKVKWVKFYNSTHSPQFEERERFYDVVANFLAID